MLDLLLGLRSLLGAYLDRAASLDLYVPGLRTGLDDASLALGVAGVGHPLYTRALVGVIAAARYAR